jgi:hypothetical protein
MNENNEVDRVVAGDSTVAAAKAECAARKVSVSVETNERNDVVLDISILLSQKDRCR